MSYTFENIEQHKKGATWDDGESRMCTRCGYERRRKRKQAIVVAFLVYLGSKYRVPVSYCKDHIPGKLTEQLKQ